MPPRHRAEKNLYHRAEKNPSKGIAYFDNYIYKNLLLPFQPLDTFLRCVFFGVSRTIFNKSTSLKNAVNPRGLRNQKNSCTIEQIALKNLKRSGFVFLINQVIEEWNTKRSAGFFDALGIAQKAHSWIDKALWVLWRVKVPCLAA